MISVDCRRVCKLSGGIPKLWPIVSRINKINPRCRSKSRARALVIGVKAKRGGPLTRRNTQVTFPFGAETGWDQAIKALQKRCFCSWTEDISAFPTSDGRPVRRGSDWSVSHRSMVRRAASSIRHDELTTLLLFHSTPPQLIIALLTAVCLLPSVCGNLVISPPAHSAGWPSSAGPERNVELSTEVFSLAKKKRRWNITMIKLIHMSFPFIQKIIYKFSVHYHII